MTASTVPYQTSPRTLAAATAGAAIVAGLVLTLFVLPAERNIDPTGIGSLIGLKGMATAASDNAPAASGAAGAAAQNVAIPTRASIVQTAPLRSDDMTVTLAPHSGVEVKAHMRKGDHFIFHWESKGGPVKVDMHGERLNAAEGEFTTYWKEKALTGAQGSLTAPFDGIHGWYWRNKGETPVTVTVHTSGFYKDLFERKAG